MLARDPSGSASNQIDPYIKKLEQAAVKDKTDSIGKHSQEVVTKFRKFVLKNTSENRGQQDAPFVQELLKRWKKTKATYEMSSIIWTVQ